MDKKAALAKLERELTEANLPLKKSANLVFGEGDVNCAVMFIGEAPGFNEDLQKRPFVGRAGKLLDECIKEINWKRADVFITNIVKRRPPDNRDPTEEEITAYKPYLARQIEIINPKVIATLGRFSMNYFLPLAKISRDHGKIFEFDGRIIFPLYHPAAALRATAVLNDLKADFKKLPAVAEGKFAENLPVTEQSATSSVLNKTADKPAQSKLF